MGRAVGPVLTIAGFTFVEALRNRLAYLVAAFLLVGLGVTEFVSEVAITETREFQAGFLGALLRACSVFVVSLFVITSIVREFDDKVLELTLSLPIPRATYLVGKLVGFSLLGLVVAVLCGLCLLVYAPPDQVALWVVSLLCELLIVTALSLLCLLTFSHVTTALSTVLAFYVLSRAIGAIQLMAASPLLASNSLAQQVMAGFVDALAFVLPDLGSFTLSDWLVYGGGSLAELGVIVVQTVLYVCLLGAAALFDLYRKNL